MHDNPPPDVANLCWSGGGIAPDVINSQWGTNRAQENYADMLRYGHSHRKRANEPGASIPAAIVKKRPANEWPASGSQEEPGEDPAAAV
ncbi:MAG: hypothetical protein Q7T68_19205 [Sphingopyxis sp.]|nr:hypothetical protein [Sphingopyxis sp.]